MVAESSEEAFVQQNVTYTLQVAGRFVVVENVPARVSLRTGERFFSPDTVERLQQRLIRRSGEVCPDLWKWPRTQ